MDQALFLQLLHLISFCTSAADDPNRVALELLENGSAVRLPSREFLQSLVKDKVDKESPVIGMLRLSLDLEQSTGVAFLDYKTKDYFGTVEEVDNRSEATLLCRAVPKSWGDDKNAEPTSLEVQGGAKIVNAWWDSLPVLSEPGAVELANGSSPLMFVNTSFADMSKVVKLSMRPASRVKIGDGLQEQNWKVLIASAYRYWEGGDSESSDRCMPGGYPKLTPATEKPKRAHWWWGKACRPMYDVLRCLDMEWGLYQQFHHLNRSIAALTQQTFGAFYLHRYSTPHLTKAQWLVLMYPLDAHLRLHSFDDLPPGASISIKVEVENMFGWWMAICCVFASVVIFAVMWGITVHISSKSSPRQRRQDLTWNAFLNFLRAKFSREESSEMPYSFASHTALIIIVIVPLALQYVLLSWNSMNFGLHDECRYNDNCYSPGLFLDLPMNNLWSNTPYLTVGIMYGGMVAYQDYLSILEPRAVGSRRQDFTLCYAMALSFCAEAAMSTIFHICPNRIAFQFDSQFMFVIPTLGMLSLSQNGEQHVVEQDLRDSSGGIVERDSKLLLLPAGSIRSTCYFLFFFGPLSVLNTLGSKLNHVEAMEKTSFFGLRISFMALVLPWLWIVLAAHGRLYGQGLGRQQIAWFPGLSGPTMKVFDICWAWAGRLMVCGIVVKAILSGADVSLLFFGVCMGAMMCFVVRRIVLAWARLSKARKINTTFHLFLLVAIGSQAVYVFLIGVTDKNLSAAESRVYAGENGACALFGAFDYHDLWHFLSALALGAYALLVLDLTQGLADVPRLTISEAELVEGSFLPSLGPIS